MISIISRIISGITFLIILFGAMPIHTQIFPLKPNKTQFWDANKLITFDPIDNHLLIHGEKQQKEGGKKQKTEETKTIAINAYYHEIDFFEGAFWANNDQTVTGEKETKIFSSFDGSRWFQEGIYKFSNDHSESVRIHRIHPLGNDRFLMIAFTRFEKDGKFSRFAIARRNEKKELILDQLLDMGLKWPWGVPIKIGEAPSWSSVFGVNEKYLHLLLGGFEVLRSPEALAIVHRRPGYVWLLPLNQEGRSLHLVRVFDSLGEESLDGSKRAEHCVLGCQVLPNGKFLFATRSEGAMHFGAEKQPKPKGPQDLLDPVFKNDLKLFRLMSLQDYPELLWWELDPDQKAFVKVPAPPGVPNHLQTVEDIQKFALWLEPSGRVVTTLTQ